MNIVKREFLCLLIIFSCNGIKQKDPITLNLSNETFFQIGPEVEPLTHSMQFANGNLYWWNQNKETITKFDLASKTSNHFLKYDYEGPNGIGNPMGFYLIDEDSVLFPKQGNHFVYLTNRSGKVLSVFDYYTDSVDISPAISFSTFGVNFKKSGNKIIGLNQNFRPDISTIDEKKSGSTTLFLKSTFQLESPKSSPFNSPNLSYPANLSNLGPHFGSRSICFMPSTMTAGFFMNLTWKTTHPGKFYWTIDF